MAFAALLVFMGVTATSCEDEPHKYEIADGVPTIKYVKVTSPESGDSLITAAYMDNLICIVGDNLRSTVELWFNDQKAVLNTSYMTDNTILVSVPGTIPGEVSNLMYFVTSGNDTITYPFEVIVPAPSVNSMSCEYAPAGSEATIYGNYFIDDPNVPLSIAFGNVDVTEITDIQMSQVSFIVPQGVEECNVSVTSIYGTTVSSFHYLDTRNILFDWDGSHGGITSGHGWRNGVVQSTNPEGIDGSYIYFGGVSMSGAVGGTWAEDNFSFNYWPEPENGYPELSSMPEFAEMLDRYELSELQIKFEAYVPTSNPWQSSALQMIFSGNDIVTYATGNNGYFSNTDLPRGLWIPWQLTGSYDTGDQWVTVSMNLSEFNRTHEGQACGSALSKDDFTGLTFFVWNGGVEGTDCNPVICIDNIRIVPIN